MDSIDVIIIIFVILLLTIIGLVVYYYYFYALGGQDCKPEKDADEFGIYKYDDNKKCVLSGCKTGYDLEGDKCISPPPPPPPSPLNVKPYEPRYNATPKEIKVYTREGDVKKVVGSTDNCIIISLGYKNHYKDGKLTKKVYPIIYKDQYGSCSQDYENKLFEKGSEIEPYLHSIGWKLEDSIVVVNFDYSGVSPTSFIDNDTLYVRCDSRPNRTDNSCVSYGDEYIDNLIGLGGKKYTSHHVDVDNINTCQQRCLDKKDCVAYSFHENKKHCALAGVDFEGDNFGGVNLIRKNNTNDQLWTTKIKVIHGVPLHNASPE